MRRVNPHHTVVAAVGRGISRSKVQQSRFQRAGEHDSSVTATTLAGSKLIIEDTFDGEAEFPESSFGKRTVANESAVAAGFVSSDTKSRFLSGRDADKAQVGRREVVADSPNLWQSLGKKGAQPDDPDAKAAEQIVSSTEAKSAASAAVGNPQKTSKSDMERILSATLRSHYSTVNPARQNEEQLTSTPCPISAVLEFSADMRRAYRQTGKQEVLDHYFQELAAFFVTLVVPRVTIPNSRSMSSEDGSVERADDDVLSTSSSVYKGAREIISSRFRGSSTCVLGGDGPHVQQSMRFPIMHDPTWAVSKNKLQDFRSVAEPGELRRCVRPVFPPDLASWVPLSSLAVAARQAALKAKGEPSTEADDIPMDVQRICSAAFEKIMALFSPLGVADTAKLLNHLSYFFSEWQTQERVREARKALSLNASGVPPQQLVGATDEEKALLTAAHKAAPLALSTHTDEALEDTQAGWGENSQGLPPLWDTFPLPPVITASLPDGIASGPRSVAAKAVKTMPLAEATREFELGPFGFPVPRDPALRRLVNEDRIDDDTAASLLRKYHNSIALSPRHHNAAVAVLLSNLALKFIALAYRDLTPISVSLTLLATTSFSVGNITQLRVPHFGTQYLPLLVGPLAKDNMQHRAKGADIGHVSKLELTAVSTALSRVHALLPSEIRHGDATKHTLLPTVLKGLYRQSSPMKQGVSWVRRYSNEHLSDLLWRSPIDAGTMLCLMLDYDPSASMLLRENRVIGISDLMRYSHNFRIGQKDTPAPTPRAVKHKVFTHASRSIAALWVATAKSTAEEIPDVLMHKSLGACVTPLLEGFFEEAYSDVVALPAAVGRIQAGGEWSHQHIKQPHRDVADVDPMDVDAYVAAIETRFNAVVFLGAYLMSGDIYSRVGPEGYFALVATFRAWMASVLTSLAMARRLTALGASIAELRGLPLATQESILTGDPTFRGGMNPKLVPLTRLAKGHHRATLETMHTTLTELLSPAPYRPQADSSHVYVPGVATHRNMHALLTHIQGEDKYASTIKPTPPNPNSTTVTTLTRVSSVSANTVALAVAGLRTLPSMVKAASEAVLRWDGCSTTPDAMKQSVDVVDETGPLSEDDMSTVASSPAAQTAELLVKEKTSNTRSGSDQGDSRSLSSLCSLALENILGCALGSVPAPGRKSSEAEKELITKGVSGIVKKLTSVCAGASVQPGDLHASLVALSLLSSHSNTGYRQFLNLVSPQTPAKGGSPAPNPAADRYDAIRRHLLVNLSQLPLEALAAASALKLLPAEELVAAVAKRLPIDNGSSFMHSRVRQMLVSDGMLAADTPSVLGNFNNIVDSLSRAAFEVRKDVGNVGYRALCEIIVELLAVRGRYEYIAASSAFVKRRLSEIQDAGVDCNPRSFEEGDAGSFSSLAAHIHYAAVDDQPFRMGLKVQHRPERQHFGTGAYMLVHCLTHYTFSGWYAEREASVRSEYIARFESQKTISNTIPSATNAAQQALLNAPPSAILYQPPATLLKDTLEAASVAGDTSDLSPSDVPFNAQKHVEAVLWQDRRLLCSTAARQAYLCGKALQNGHDRLLFWIGSLGDHLLKPVNATWCVGDIPLHCSAAKKAEDEPRLIKPAELAATEGRDAANLQSLILQSIEAAQQAATVASFKRVAHAVALLNSCGAHAEVGVSLLTIANRLYSDRKLFVPGAVYDYVVACSLHLSTIPNISLVLGHLRHDKLTNDEMKHIFRGITVAAENEAVTSHHRATIVDLAKKALISDSVSLQCATLRALAITRCGSSSVFRQLSALVVLKRHQLTIDEVGDAVSCAKYTDLADDVLCSGLREELMKRLPTMQWESARALLPWMASAFIGDKELWTLVVARYKAVEGDKITDAVLIASLCESANSDLAELPQHVMSSK